MVMLVSHDGWTKIVNDPDSSGYPIIRVPEPNHRSRALRFVPEDPSDEPGFHTRDFVRTGETSVWGFPVYRERTES